MLDYRAFKFFARQLFEPLSNINFHLDNYDYLLLRCYHSCYHLFSIKREIPNARFQSNRPLNTPLITKGAYFIVQMIITNSSGNVNNPTFFQTGHYIIFEININRNEIVMQKTCDFLKFCCKTANGERLCYLVTVESLDLTKNPIWVIGQGLKIRERAG